MCGFYRFAIQVDILNKGKTKNDLIAHTIIDISALLTGIQAPYEDWFTLTGKQGVDKVVRYVRGFFSRSGCLDLFD